jgi:hypothetical protein
MLRASLISAVFAMPLVACVNATTSSISQNVTVPDELKTLQTAFAKYNDFANAVADGYQLGYRGAAKGCVFKPNVGAMGYHYFNWSLMDAGTIDPNNPTVLVYHTDPDDGSLKLGAVEWVVAQSTWNSLGNTAPPVVYGQTLHIINPVLNWYVQHAWMYTNNPAGIYQDWNPNVSCP